MANPQVENGFTRISNELLEQAYRLKLNGTQFRILMVVWRFSYGFSRSECAVSETFISNAISANKKQVARELRALIQSNIITVVKEATHTSARTIKFNKDYDGWKLNSGQGANKHTVSQLVYTGGNESADLRGSDLAPQERKYLKKSFKESKPIKHKHGEYKNVLLTDEQKDRLINELGQSIFDKCIEKLDTYIQESGKRYSDHNLTIRRWVIQAVTQQEGGKTYGENYKTDGADSTDYYKQFTAQ